MCIRSHSESGQPCGFEPCEAYIKLLSEKSRLEGLCAGLELGNKINLERIKRQDEQLMEMLSDNEAVCKENQLLRAENANLSMAHGPGNHTDWMLTRASKYEQLHKDLEALRQERDTYLTVLEAAGYRLIEDMPSKGLDYARAVGEMVFRVSEKAIQECDRLAGIVEKADALEDALENKCKTCEEVAVSVVSGRNAIPTRRPGMDSDMTFNVEGISSKVHDGWWDEKKRQGFHAPMNCPVLPSGEDDKFKTHCPKCHTDMYPYEELPENIKDYDRVTVRQVLTAIYGDRWKEARRG